MPEQLLRLWRKAAMDQSPACWPCTLAPGIESSTHPDSKPPYAIT